MYEFLAPWGALLPLFSAAVTYVWVTEKRRKNMIQTFEMPPRTSRPSSRIEHSRLSMAHG